MGEADVPKEKTYFALAILSLAVVRDNISEQDTVNRCAMIIRECRQTLGSDSKGRVAACKRARRHERPEKRGLFSAAKADRECRPTRVDRWSVVPLQSAVNSTLTLQPFDDLTRQ